DHVGMTFELVADRGPDEIGAVRVEPFLHHQVDLTEIDKTEIDRDLFGIGGLWSDFINVAGHFLPSIEHLMGWYMDGRRETSRATTVVSGSKGIAQAYG